MSGRPAGAAPAASTAIWGRPARREASVALPRRAEVVVIGGGITGVAVLTALRRRGVDAVLVERDHLAAGASGRNAGFLLAGVAENYARAVHAYGRDVARELWRFTIANHAMIAAAVPTPASVGYRQTGSLTVAVDDEEAASLEEAATLLAEDGFAGGLSDDAPPFARRALLNPADGEVDPVRLVAALAAPHADRIVERSAVTALEPSNSGCTVHVGTASIAAPTVVLATNAWTSQLAPTVAIRPVRAQMAATAPADQRVAERPVYAEWGHRYWRQREDGVVLVGGFRHRALEQEVGYDLGPTPAVQSHLDAQLADLGVRAAVTHRWAGTMGFSADGLPLAGEVDGMPGVWVCGGYTGHGMGFAVHAAGVLVARMLDGTALAPWLDSRRTVHPNAAP